MSLLIQRLALMAVCFAAGGLCSDSALAQSTVTYIGPSGGLWSDPGNWSTGIVPVNSGTDTFNVILPAGLNVELDLPGETVLTGLSAEANSSITIVERSLEVLGVALITDAAIAVDGEGAAFLTAAPFVGGQNQSLSVSQGGLALLPISSHILTNERVGNVITADGNGARINLSSATLIDASAQFSQAFVFDATSTYLASNNGVIDASGVTEIRGGGGNALRFQAESGGFIDLSSVTGISSGGTSVILNGGTVNLSSLTTVNNTQFTVPASEVLDLPKLTSATNAALEVGDGGAINALRLINATGVTFGIASGGTVNAPALTNVRGATIDLTPSTTLNAPTFTEIDDISISVSGGVSISVADTSHILTNAQVGDVLVADGNGSRLDFSSVTLIDASAQFSRAFIFDATTTFRASNQGVIDVSGVTEIRGGGGSQLRFQADSAGLIDLSSVTDISSGNTAVILNGGAFDFSSLRTASNLEVSVPVFQTLDLPELRSATSTLFGIENGGVVNAPLLTDVSGLAEQPLETQRRTRSDGVPSLF